MNKQKLKFKPGDRVMVYGKVKAIITGWDNYSNSYQVGFLKKLPGDNHGWFPEHALELVEIWESPLYQALMED